MDEKTDSGERRMNPVAMTIINPQKEYRPSRESNQQLPVLKSATLQTELWGLAHQSVTIGTINKAKILARFSKRKMQWLRVNPFPNNKY